MSKTKNNAIKLTADDRCALISRVAKWCFSNTESFELDSIGTGLAYLSWAVAADDGEPFDFLTKEVPDYYRKFKELLQSNPNGLWQELLDCGFIRE